MRSILNYHKLRFGWKQNINVLKCRIFGHRINENPAHHWCERCGLSYEDIYSPKNYYHEAGIAELTGADLKIYKDIVSKSPKFNQPKEARKDTDEIDGVKSSYFSNDGKRLYSGMIVKAHGRASRLGDYRISYKIESGFRLHGDEGFYMDLVDAVVHSVIKDVTWQVKAKGSLSLLIHNFTDKE